MKIKIIHGPEEQKKAEEVFQALQRLFPRSRRHETQQDGRRVLYLTAKPYEQRANAEEHPKGL